MKPNKYNIFNKMMGYIHPTINYTNVRFVSLEIFPLLYKEREEQSSASIRAERVQGEVMIFL